MPLKLTRRNLPQHKGWLVAALLLLLLLCGQKIRGLLFMTGLSSALTLRGHNAGVTSVAFSPDGSLIASASGDGTVKLWTSRTGALARTLIGHRYVVGRVAFSPDGKTLASGDNGVHIKQPGETGYVEQEDGSLKLWNVQTGALLWTQLSKNGSVSNLAFSPDGTMLAAGSTLSRVVLRDPQTGASLRVLKSGVPIAFSPDGNTLATSPDLSLMGTVRGSQVWWESVKLWNPRTGQALRTLAPPPPPPLPPGMGSHGGPPDTGSVSALAFLRDGRSLVVGHEESIGDALKLWDTQTGKLLRTLPGQSDIRALAVAPDGKTLASGGMGHSTRPGSPLEWTLKLWDTRTWTVQRTINGDAYFISTLAFSPDGKLLAGGGADGTVKLWKMK